MFKNIIIIILLLACYKLTYSQSTKVIRAEIESSEKSKPFQIANYEKKGIIVLNKLNEFFDRKTLNFQFTFYDNILQKKWQKKIALSEDYNFYGNFSIKDSLMIILYKESRKTNDPNLLIINFNPTNGGFVVSEFTIKEKNILIDIKQVENNLILIFENKNEDFLVTINSNNRIFAETLINATKEKSTIEDFKIDTTDSIFYLLYKKQLSRREFKFFINSYDFEGNKLNTLEIKNDDETKQLLSAKISSIDNKQLIITGSYNLSSEKTTTISETSKLESAGMYFLKINSDGSLKTTFFNYLYFDNIGKYLNKREVSKIKKGQEKEINIEQSLNYLVLEHEAFVENKEIILISEAFYPEYRTVSDMSYDYYGRMTPTSRTVFDGYRYTNAFILCLDKNGTPKWNQLFDIWNILTMDLKDRVSIIFIDNEMVMAYNNEGEIVYKVLNNTSTVTEIDKIKIETLFPNDKVMSNLDYNLFHWYQNYFIAYGTQVIKNNSLANKSKRIVFYMNKISFE